MMSARRNKEKPPTQPEILRRILSDGRLHRARDLLDAGVHRATVQRAVASGDAYQFERGLVGDPALMGTPGLGFAGIAARYPTSVVCMFSAAQWHDLSDEDPAVAWIALPRDRDRSMIQGRETFPVQTVWWGGAQMEVGVSTVDVAGIPVRITDPARTVADLLRHRDQTGDEPALKALHDFVRVGGDIGLLARYAKALGAWQALEPFVHAAEEFGESVPRRAAR